MLYLLVLLAHGAYAQQLPPSTPPGALPQSSALGAPAIPQLDITAPAPLGSAAASGERLAITAVRIVGNKIMTSERFEVLVRPERGVSPDSVRIHRLRGQDVAQGLPADEAMKQLMRFIGSRPLVGYFLEFDVAMLNRAIWPLLGQGLPQPKIEVSAMYYDHKFRQMLPYEQQTNPNIDLRFATLMSDLDLPVREAHDALNDAVMAAMAFIKLRQLRGV